MGSTPAVADVAVQPRAPGTVLRITGLSKTFPGTKALDDVTLEVAEGEIHALVGQNGSGKSTLIKVLAGYHRADPGAKAWLNGEPFDVADTADRRHHRLRFVHQDLGLFLELGATDNLALRGEFLLDPLHRIRWRAQAAVTRELLSQFDLDLDLNRPLAEATPVQRTVVAIAAALVGWEGGPGVLVLDEPTAVLPPHDVTRLLEIIERVRGRGTSILYVSHRLDEVFRLADRVTVLRGGRVVQTRPVAGLTTQTLAELMVGSEVDAGYRAGLTVAPDRPVVLRARDVRGRFLDGVDLDLAEGEVLGVGRPARLRSQRASVRAGRRATRGHRPDLGGGQRMAAGPQVGFLRHPAGPGRPGRGGGDQRVQRQGEPDAVGTAAVPPVWPPAPPAEQQLADEWTQTIEVKAASWG